MPRNRFPHKAVHFREEVCAYFQSRGCHPLPDEKQRMESAEYWYTPAGEWFAIPYKPVTGFTEILVQDLIMRVHMADPSFDP